MSHDTSVPPDPNIELVAVFRSGDQGQIVVAKSLLEAEGIEYLVRSEGLQDLFGWGRLAIGFSNVVGPAEFLVRKEDGDRARELLRDLTQ
jgi:hypothetical protein